MDNPLKLPHQDTSKNTPYTIATGFTAAYLGDERTLREFVVGNHLKEQIAYQGQSAILYLINDSYDALNYRQLRIAVNKNEKLLKQFEGYCGRPIAEIPDPFGCHESYAQHFAEALLTRLRSLDIHPIILDTYQAYQNGKYASFITTVFENYSRIQNQLAENFDAYSIRNLFHAQCPNCHSIDVTHIRTVEFPNVQFECERCQTHTEQHVTDLKGKLSWKLDCAARWNLYGIDMETFSKAHLTQLGSYSISQFISQRYFGAQVPTPVKYGAVKISQALSNKLLEILPPEIFKRIFTDHITRDIEITRDSVENFCHKFFIKPGLSYVDYVLNELPRETVSQANWNDLDKNEDRLISYGNLFSKFYYKKDHRLRLPDIKTIAATDPDMLKIIRDIIYHTLTVHSESLPENKNILINSYLQNRQDLSSKVYRCARRMLGQSEGPKFSTLLSLLPRDYLDQLLTLLDSHITSYALPISNKNNLLHLSKYHHQKIRSADDLSLTYKLYPIKRVG